MFMYEYTHGGNIYGENGTADENMLDFSANINPLGIPAEAISAAKNAVTQSNVYPDSNCLRLTSELAEFENVDKTDIFCSNGASDILFRLVYAAKPKKILVTAPSFADYERAGRAAGAEIIHHKLKKENCFNIDETFAGIIREASPDIVFICNPNNPTGRLTDIKMLEIIASACQAVNSFLLIDECFLDFVPDSYKYSAKPLTKKYRNIVILKAFTKIFAMPGLRLGYAICSDKAMTERMRFCGADWAVSNIAQAAGIAVLKNAKEFINNSVAYIKKERERITEELSCMGLTVYQSYANFILFHCAWNNIDLRGELLKTNISIRDCSNFAGLEPGYYRTAVLTEDKNNKLIEALRKVKILWQNQ